MKTRKKIQAFTTALIYSVNPCAAWVCGGRVQKFTRFYPVLTAIKHVLTEKDLVLTGIKHVLTGIKLVLTAFKLVLTAAEHVLTAFKLVLTAAELVLTGFKLVLTAAELVLTGFKLVLTAAELVLTWFKLVLTPADPVWRFNTSLYTVLKGVFTGLLRKQNVFAACRVLWPPPGSGCRPCAIVMVLRSFFPGLFIQIIQSLFGKYHIRPGVVYNRHFHCRPP